MQWFLLLLFFVWYPVRAVCLNYEVVVFQPWTGTAPYLGSAAIFTTIIDATRPTCFNRFWIYCFISRTWFLFPTRLPPVDAASLYCCTCDFPSQLAWARSDRPPGRRPHPPASTACLCFPSFPGIIKINSRERVSDVPCRVAPTFPSSTCSQVPVSSRGYHVWCSLIHLACNGDCFMEKFSILFSSF